MSSPSPVKIIAASFAAPITTTCQRMPGARRTRILSRTKLYGPCTSAGARLSTRNVTMPR